MNNMIEVTAFLPVGLFGVVWEYLLIRIQNMLPAVPGSEEHPFVTYLKTSILSADDNYGWDATWRSDAFLVSQGFSTYTQNSLESFWRLLKRSIPRKSKTLAFMVFCTKFERVVKRWMDDGKWAGLCSQVDQGR
eukprot:6130720-Karenia_brevis.AAC.1